ncbi:MAG: hypothetical protein K2Q18_16705 [Bdellovibrionales bacterium]|nr:hypothetical protein [Bdellovibrionales bacterium]
MKSLTILAILSTLMLASCATNESKRQAELDNLELQEVAGDLQDRPVIIGEKTTHDVLLENNTSRKNTKDLILSTIAPSSTATKK